MKNDGRIYRWSGLVIGLACLLGASISGAQAFSAGQACADLAAQVGKLPGGASFRCSQSGDSKTLIVAAQSRQTLLQARAHLFPENTYSGFKVQAAAEMSEGLTPASLQAALQSERIANAATSVRNALPKEAVNYDGAAPHAGGIVLVSGPPGSEAASGPPGSEGASGPPGSEGETRKRKRRSGPPGSEGAGNDDSRHGGGAGVPSTRPPSRRTPVWRSAPPPPDWWNTYESEVWNSPLSNYEDDSFDENAGIFVSRWYPWPDAFVSKWKTSGEVKSIERTVGNQDRVFRVDLHSEVSRTRKTCYYRAYVKYHWVKDGFYGEHYQEEFDHYKAACYKQIESGPSQYRRVDVRFDMEARSLLPGEREKFNVAFDGRDVSVSPVMAAPYSPSYEYAEARNDGETVILRAGRKLRTYADPLAVRVELIRSEGRLQVSVSDDLADVYKGEPIAIAVQVKKSCGVFCFDKVVMEFKQNDPLMVKMDPGQKRRTYDVRTTGGGEYYIKFSNFRRADSQISIGDWVGWTYEGPRVKY